MQVFVTCTLHLILLGDDQVKEEEKAGGSSRDTLEEIKRMHEYFSHETGGEDTI
jgi:hypothetical protein